MPETAKQHTRRELDRMAAFVVSLLFLGGTITFLVLGAWFWAAICLVSALGFFGLARTGRWLLFRSCPRA